MLRQQHNDERPSSQRAIRSCVGAVPNDANNPPCAPTPWRFLTHIATDIRPSTSDSLTQCIRPSSPMPAPMLALPLVAHPANPQSMVASNAISDKLPRRIVRPHCSLPQRILEREHAMTVLRPSTVDHLTLMPSVPAPPSWQVVSVQDPSLETTSRSAFTKGALLRAMHRQTSESTASSSDDPAPSGCLLPSASIGDYDPEPRDDDGSYTHQEADLPVSLRDEDDSVNRSQGHSTQVRRVRFEEDDGTKRTQLAKRAVVQKLSASKLLAVSSKAESGSRKDTSVVGVRSPSSATTTPDSTNSRRSSRAMFVERMSMLKSTLSRTVQDVASDFLFFEDADQLRALNDVVSGIDEAFLGQEFAIAHPMQPVSSSLLEDLSENARRMRFRRHAPSATASSNSVSASPRSTRNSPRPSQPTEVLQLMPPVIKSNAEGSASVFGRRDSAYYLEVAESRRKTGAAASGDQLFLAAEEMELHNAKHVQQLMPRHDAAMQELKLLGLV